MAKSSGSPVSRGGRGGEVGLDRVDLHGRALAADGRRRSPSWRAAGRRTSAAPCGRPCSRASRRSPGRWRSGPGGSARRACPRQRCRDRGPFATGDRQPLGYLDRMMEPVVAVKTLLLQTQLPDVTLRPGTSVVARVLSRGEDHGVLVIAGDPADRPAADGDRQAGETLRLTCERRHAGARDAPARAGRPAGAAQPPPTADAVRARHASRSEPRTVRVGDEERSSVALSFQSERARPARPADRARGRQARERDASRRPPGARSSSPTPPLDDCTTACTRGRGSRPTCA